MTLLLVAVGGAAGAAVRYAVGVLLPGRRATLAVNLLGSLLLGLLAGLVDPAAPAAHALLGVGFCGALTTFGTFALEVVDGGGLRYAGGTAVGCLVACALGLLIAPA